MLTEIHKDDHKITAVKLIAETEDDIETLTELINKHKPEPKAHKAIHKGHK